MVDVNRVSEFYKVQSNFSDLGAFYSDLSDALVAALKILIKYSTNYL